MIRLTLINIAIFQGVVIGLLLLFSPFFKSKANKYLAFSLFSLSLSLLNLVLDITQVYNSFPFFKVVDIIDTSLMFPVLIYLFVLYKTSQKKISNKKLVSIISPIIILILFSIIDACLFFYNDNSLFFSNIGDVIDCLSFFIFIVFTPYIFIKTYYLINKSNYSDEKRWLNYLFFFEVLLLTLWLLVIIISPFVRREISSIAEILALIFTLLIHWIAYTGVYKLKLINDRKKIRNYILKNNLEEIKNDSNEVVNLKKENKISKDNVYFLKLEKLCLEEKIYRNNTLDRNIVASMLDISPSYVSQIINAITEDNFTNYINRYRVEEVKKFIIDKTFDNYSLLAIGLEAGFSSKTTFYNSFKKITGVTPNSYRKLHK